MDKYHIISLYMWGLKKGTNELIYKTEIELQLYVETKLMVMSKRRQGGRNWEIGIDIYTYCI